MSSRPSVLFIYGRHIGISDKLVGLYQLQYLEKAGRIDLNIKAFWNVSYADLAGCDCVYACRLALYSLRWFFRVAKGLGKRIVFGLDDDLLSVPKDVPSHLLYGNRFFKKNFEKELALVDVLVSPSKKILAKYGGMFGISSCYRLEEPAMETFPYHRHEGPVRICFAGSVDRQNDFENLLSEVIVSLKRRYGEQVEFCFIGNHPSCADAVNAVVVPKLPYGEYWEFIRNAEIDIGLAPMPDTEFHSCKHYNKFMEYARAGICGVYSNVQPYTEIRDFFPQVILADNNPDSWFSCLSELVQDRSKLEEQRRLALDCIGSCFSIDGISDGLFDAIAGHGSKKAEYDVGRIRFTSKTCAYLAMDFLTQGFCFLLSRI